MADFNAAYNITLKVEAGYANDPDDNGQETFAGVSRKSNPDWKGWALIDKLKLGRSPKDFDKVMFGNAELMGLVRAIYKARYWDINRLDEIKNQAIANELFDTGVNMGVSVAAKMLQRALNVLNQNQVLYPDMVVDGVVGSVTVKRVNEHPYPALVLKILNVLQGYRYIEIAEKAPVQEKFMCSWMSRVEV